MSDEIFDPEIHATDKDGNPSLNKDGSFRKKRKDAGGGRRGGGGGSAPFAAAASGGGRRSGGDQRAKHHKAVSDFLQVPVTVASLVNPVYGYAAGMVAPMWADVLADLALVNPRLAAALEKAGGLGAAGGVAAVGLLTLAQFGVLAGKVPDSIGQMVGAKPRAEIEAILEQRGVQLRREAGERARQDAEDAEARVVGEHFDKVSGEPGRYTGGVAHEYASAV